MKMAVQDGGGKDELKTQFITREGTYRLMTLSEYSRPNRVGYTNTQGNAAVRVSFVTLPDSSGNGDRICFNLGRELYVYVYKGVKKAADLTKPVDKKMYKGTNPTCHDFNLVTMTADSVSLMVGFSTGQIQLIDPIKKELNKLYNEERLIDKTKVTCIRWVPGSANLFLVSHASGQLYLYNEELPCGTAAPHYQPFKHGEGFAIHTCKTKSTRNPLYRWVIGAEGCCINEFAFSPCGTHLAIVSQDGFLRVFHYDTMELLGAARSYFGGFLCVCWSPDGRYVVVGGEDDLVTVWSFHDRRVVARGQGHRSWVSVVAFDPYLTAYSDTPDGAMDSDDEGHVMLHNCNNNRNSSDVKAACYRLGSVGQDTQLCLWDITEDILRQPVPTKSRALGASGTFSPNGAVESNNLHNHTPPPTSGPPPPPAATPSAPTLTQRLAGLGSASAHRRNFSRGGGGGGGGGTDKTGLYSSANQRSAAAVAAAAATAADDPMRLIGTGACPRFDECPVLEPLVCKKIAHERLTALAFREDCFVTACQDGYVYTWARPGRMPGGGEDSGWGDHVDAGGGCPCPTGTTSS